MWHVTQEEVIYFQEELQIFEDLYLWMFKGDV